jgi:16S rRNA (cytidine1402-2'-O)-methyltransferase
MGEYGTLYVVATPIGNLGDMTYRGVDILNSVDIVFAEDTRQFKKLADKYNIKTKTSSYNAHASTKTHERIIEILYSGKNIALVSDAGTPGISDPGSLIVSILRNNHKDIKIIPIPGASALTAAVSVSGILGNSFVFMGFAPNKKGRETFFNEVLKSAVPSVFYESTHRIMNLLNWFSKNSPDTKIMLFREITKMFETVNIGTPDEHLEIIKNNPKELKGEFTVIINK